MCRQIRNSPVMAVTTAMMTMTITMTMTMTMMMMMIIIIITITKENAKFIINTELGWNSRGVVQKSININQHILEFFPSKKVLAFQLYAEEKQKPNQC